MLPHANSVNLPVSPRAGFGFGLGLGIGAVASDSGSTGGNGGNGIGNGNGAAAQRLPALARSLSRGLSSSLDFR
jgi:hypothetical protein